MSKTFDGTTVLVTGADGAIGVATAVQLAARGANVLCVDRDLDAATPVVRSIADAGGRAAAHRAGVAEEDSVVSYAEAALAFGGGMADGSFNNAGIEEHRWRASRALPGRPVRPAHGRECHQRCVPGPSSTSAAD